MFIKIVFSFLSDAPRYEKGLVLIAETQREKNGKVYIS